MKAIVIAKFGGFDNEEEREIRKNALDIYKFFKLLSNSYCFDLNAIKNVLGFKMVVDLLSDFLPFIMKNYNTIINFNENNPDEFLYEITQLVLNEKNFNHTNGEALLTNEDIERYADLPRVGEVIKNIIFSDINSDDFFEFLKNRGLVASFYNECCC